MIVGIFIIFKRGHFADFFKTRGTIAASAGPEFRTQRIWRKWFYNYFRKESFIVDVRLSSRYTSGKCFEKLFRSHFFCNFLRLLRRETCQFEGKRNMFSPSYNASLFSEKKLDEKTLKRLTSSLTYDDFSRKRNNNMIMR